MVRIAHITDIHARHHIPGQASIPVRRSRAGRDLLERALSDARKRQADVVVLTGDVLDVPQWFTSDGDNQGNCVLDRQVREDYRMVRTLLDECGLPWISLPGNHDSYRLHAEELSRGPYVRDIGGLRFVSFWDSESEGNVPRRILTERLRFESALVDPSRRPQVHLQHFVIQPRLDSGYPHTYQEGEFLYERLVESHKVALVLSGHYHAGVPTSREGRTTFSVTPALAEYPHPYRIFDVAMTGQEWSVADKQINLATQTAPQKAVFLDRDGCITEHPTFHHGPQALQLLPAAAPALRLLREHGYALVVVTNQSCVGLGYVDVSTLDQVQHRMSALLWDEDAHVDAIYSSLGAGDHSISERYNDGNQPKPSSQMLLRAASELNLDLTSSYMVGDRLSDIDAARAAGVTPLLVRTGDGRLTEREITGSSLVVDDLAMAAAWIVRNSEPDQTRD